MEDRSQIIQCYSEARVNHSSCLPDSTCAHVFISNNSRVKKNNHFVPNIIQNENAVYWGLFKRLILKRKSTGVNRKVKILNLYVYGYW